MLDALLSQIAADSRIVGVCLTGSLGAGRGDEHSDVDLVLVTDDAQHESVMSERMRLIASWAPLVAGFTGEHVGEPRLIITLLGPPLVHVDFTFVRISDVGRSVRSGEVVHDTAGAVAAELDRAGADAGAGEPGFDLQWAEDRFWVWVHYAATKAARGEWFEVLDLLGFVRGAVLGPLAAVAAGREARGVRRIESVAPVAAVELRSTVCGYEPAAIVEALLASIALYRRWRDGAEARHAVAAAAPLVRNVEAERLAMEFLDVTLAGLHGR
ncbi:hypothetical protein GCM10009851_04940 [Herbiconiux moechotypicola]|uniref:Nucleotidyltransferase domain-containing protein n=2 Tax=Herbiconiux moechotypicola TaxID=637393 RepID=A0ABP5Q2R5_9MICO